MNATVFSVKLTMQTLEFRNDPRWPNGSYVMVTTDFGSGVVERRLFGPLDASLIAQFKQEQMTILQEQFAHLEHWLQMPRPAGMIATVGQHPGDYWKPGSRLSTNGEVEEYVRLSPDGQEFWSVFKHHGVWYWRVWDQHNALSRHANQSYSAWDDAAVACGRSYLT